MACPLLLNSPLRECQLSFEVPSRIVLDVNLLGVLYFARIASVYLRQNRRVGEDKSLILLSSVAALKESPGLPVYAVSIRATWLE